MSRKTILIFAFSALLSAEMSGTGLVLPEDNPQRALQMIDAAQQQGKLPGWRADSLRMRVCYNNFYDLNRSMEYAQRVLEHDSVKRVDGRHIAMLSFTTRLAMLLGRYSESIRYCTEGAKLATRLHDEYHQAQFSFTMGKCMYKMNEKENGLEQMLRSTHALEGKTDGKSCRLLSYFYGQLTNTLWTDNPQKAIEMAQRREQLIQRVERHLQSKEKTCQDAFDIYKDIDLGYGLAYSDLAALYAQQGEMEEAHRYAQLFQQTQFSKTVRGKQVSLDYYNSTHQADKLINTFRECRSYWDHKDTICSRYATVMSFLARAYEQKGDIRQALQYRIRQIHIKDSVFSRESMAENHRLAAIYKMHEKEMELLQEQARARQYFVLACTVLLLLLLAIAFALYWHHQHGEILAKNQILVKQLDEELARSAKRLQEERMKRAKRNPATNPEVVKRFHQLMNEEKVYLQPDFNRDRLQQQLGVGKNSLTLLLRDLIGENANLNDYLSDKRITHACTLLKTKRAMTIEAIAQESGYSTSRNFRRCFKLKTGMSPAEYREACRS